MIWKLRMVVVQPQLKKGFQAYSSIYEYNKSMLGSLYSVDFVQESTLKSYILDTAIVLCCQQRDAGLILALVLAWHSEGILLPWPCLCSQLGIVPCHLLANPKGRNWRKTCCYFLRGSGFRHLAGKASCFDPLTQPGWWTQPGEFTQCTGLRKKQNKTNKLIKNYLHM